MASWIETNKNREAIKAVNRIVRLIAENIDYDNTYEVLISSALIRRLHAMREELYWEGLL